MSSKPFRSLALLLAFLTQSKDIHTDNAGAGSSQRELRPRLPPVAAPVPAPTGVAPKRTKSNKVAVAAAPKVKKPNPTPVSDN